jgi:hypothetical protein
LPRVHLRHSAGGDVHCLRLVSARAPQGDCQAVLTRGGAVLMPNRLLREGLMESERVLSVPVEARWLFVIIVLSADDLGLFEATEFKLARRADVRREHVDKLMQTLLEADLIRLYQVEDKRYGFIPRFRQRIRIKRPKYPLPSEALMSDDQDALSKIKGLGSSPSDAHQLSNGWATDGQPPEAEAKAKATSSSSKTRGGRKALDLPSWIAEVKAKGDQPIPDDDPVFEYARKVDLPPEFVALAWQEFKAKYSQPDARKCTYWRAVFGKAVRGNWLKLWYPEDKGYALTTAGVQARRVKAPA